MQDVGVLYIGRGNASLEKLGAAHLNPLELHKALTERGEAPELLRELYSETAQPRGWLGRAIESSATSLAAAPCADSWFLARHGNLQTGYNHHDGPHSGAWLNWYTNSYTAWTRHNIDSVKMGFCVQQAPDYTHLYFKYRTAGSSVWQTAYENWYVPAGSYYWWYCNGCNDYDWSERVEPLDWGVYDMGFDWS